MAEKVNVIDIKKRKLVEELNSEFPRKQVIKRLKESIERHKGISRYIRDRRIKTKRGDRRRWKMN